MMLNKLKKIFKKEKPVPSGTFNKLTMNEAAKKQMNTDLKAAESMAAIFDVLKKYYDLENCKPGAITKAAMIGQLQKGVLFVGAKPKKDFK